MISYLFNSLFTTNIELQIDTISIPKFFQIGMLPGVGDDRHGETSLLFSGHCQADSVDGNAAPADNVLIVLFRIFNVNKQICSGLVDLFYRTHSIHMTLYNMSVNRFRKCERSLQMYLIATFQVSGRGLTECLFRTLDFKMVFIKRDNSQTNPVHGDTLINMNIS